VGFSSEPAGGHVIRPWPMLTAALAGPTKLGGKRDAGIYGGGPWRIGDEISWTRVPIFSYILLEQLIIRRMTGWSALQVGLIPGLNFLALDVFSFL
jgi:hypothetical protein